jgi:predicted phage baseplate assembly protein
LEQRPLTCAAAFDASAAAADTLTSDPRTAVPVIQVVSDRNFAPLEWRPTRDLLEAGPETPAFVVEIEHDQAASLRFGQHGHGKAASTAALFDARYRIGTGISGNVGLGSIAHIISDQPEIMSVSNPLPARGGVDPESAEAIRQSAPYAFRTQERAVTEADYAEVAERAADVQQAAATFRWTGSWHTAFVTVDRSGGLAVDDQFEQAMRRHLETYRLAGQDLEVDGPRFVPLELEVHVCLEPGYFRSDVKGVLDGVFSSRTLPDGRRGLFHPDRYTFGQPVYLSPLYAAAQSVTGVASVEITTFQRLGQPDAEPLQTGQLQLGRLEIAQLNNDANFPERGVCRLIVRGGK